MDTVALFLISIGSFSISVIAGAQSASRVLFELKEDPFSGSEEVAIKSNKDGFPDLKVAWWTEAIRGLLSLGIAPLYGGLIILAVGLVDSLFGSLILSASQAFAGLSDLAIIWILGVWLFLGFYMGRATVFGFAARQAIKYLNRVDYTPVTGYIYVNRITADDGISKHDVNYKKIFTEALTHSSHSQRDL